MKDKEIRESEVESDLCVVLSLVWELFSVTTLLAMSPELTRCARAPWALPPTKETISCWSLFPFKRTFA